MIYLIDDRNERLIGIDLSYLDNGTYSDVLTSVQHFVFAEHENALAQAKAILYHSSTPVFHADGTENSGRKEVLSKIQDGISKRGEAVPLVFFSGGASDRVDFDEDEEPDFIPEMPKRLFYARLPDFLNHCRTTGATDLRILAYGLNHERIKVAAAADTLLARLNSFGYHDALPTAITAGASLTNFLQDCGMEGMAGQAFSTHLSQVATRGGLEHSIHLILESFALYGKNIYRPDKQ